ncbi:MAG TPA: 4-hydroxy-tetrahydrodipicolinate synthase [Rhodanobacteraceae bacterium]|nr:4-hydroxy-tetrahydrodipicolinate synthase [Rhodanobacteraceae bacterium]
MAAATHLNLSGSICALATPFRGDRAADLDLEAFGRLIDHQLAGGTSALVVAGSTGEAAALDEIEFSRLVEFAVVRVEHRVPVLAGSGQQSTRKTVAQTRRAQVAGCDAALVVVPPYVRATQEGLYRHFSEVAEEGGLPVVLYNVPTRTAGNLDPATTARLARHGNIVGIKEAVAEPVRMQELLELRNEHFGVLSGDDATAARAMLSGADGVVSVAANLAPQAMATLAKLCAKGRSEQAMECHHALQELYDLLGIESNPIPLKWCLARIGFGQEQLRLPLVTLSPEGQRIAARVLAKLELIEVARACDKLRE